MAKRIFKRAKAEGDVYDQALYIAQDDMEAARRYVFTVEKAISSLAENPKSGSVYKTKSARLKGLRKIPVPGFKDLIFYLELADRIEIVRIIHAARDIQRILKGS